MPRARRAAPGWTLAALTVAALAAAPFLATRYLVSFLLLMFMYVALAQSWNMISGYTGYFSLGHGVFFGVGAYTAGQAVTALGWPVPLAFVAAPVAALALALVLGVVFMRVRMKIAYFAIATLGLNEIVKTLIANNDWLGASHGMTLPPVPIRVPYYLLLVLAVATTLVVRWIDRSEFGLGLRAIYQDEEAAEVMGVPTARAKILVFVVSAVFPGLIGAVVAWYWSYIDPYQAFDLNISFDMSVMAVFGGVGTVWGPVLGAAIIGILIDTLWVSIPHLHGVVFGVLVIVMVVVSPGGLVELGGRVRDRWRRPRAPAMSRAGGPA
jgi:branched-chain amino acid transport system permease protein